jgi:dipeptidyl aminopeptidase/acylaminoacyl peptidase
MNLALRGMLLRLLLVWIGSYSAAQAQRAGAEDNGLAKQPVTVADTIEMTRIGDYSYLDPDRGGQFSPDGSKFAFVTQKGDLKTDSVEFRLLVFRTADAFNSPRTEVVATLPSTSSRAGICQVQWLPDNDTLVFLGEQAEGTSQLYKVSVRTKKLEKLTNQQTPILYYSMSDRGDNFLYVADASPLPVLSSEMLRRGFFVTSQQWDDLYTNRRRFDTRHEIFVKTPRMKMPQRAGGVLDLYPFSSSRDLHISPNGRYALLRAYRTTPPVAWDEYQYKSDTETAPSAGACRVGEAFRCPQQMMVVDLERRTVEPLLNAPATGKTAGSDLAAWTRENSVLLVNALLPLDSVEGEERSRRLSHVYAVEMTLPERKILKISERQEPYPVVFIESDVAKDRIIVKPKLAILAPSLEFRRDISRWKITEISGPTREHDSRLSVTLEQDINSPPKLVANNPKTKRKAVVLDLNPQFSQLSFGRVEIFPWKAREGQFGEGMLYYPPDYVAGKKYPLIIQTHDERRDRFWIDGPYTTAYAAQPLANKGFLVLQMGLADVYEKASQDEVYKILGTPQEGPHYMALFESAIDELDQRGLIDRNRVGLSGFSRTFYHVLFALAHSSHHFAAAVAADGIDFSYVWCLYYLPRFADSSVCVKVNGGPPYGEGLAGWAKAAPTFNLDKVRAPLLLQAISAPLGEWEVFAGLQWLKKPVEMLNFYPEGEHQLVRPQQRLLSQGSVVDWYCFWLKEEEDPDPAKAEQYARWRKMKQERDKR